MKDSLIVAGQQADYGTDTTDQEVYSRQDSTESLGIDDVDMGDDYQYNQSGTSSREIPNDANTHSHASRSDDTFPISHGSADGMHAVIPKHPKADQYDLWLSSGSIFFWLIFTGWLYAFFKAAKKLNVNQNPSYWEELLLIILPIGMYILLIIYPLGSHIIFDPDVSSHQLKKFLCKRAFQHLCIVVLPTALLFCMFIYGVLCEFSNGEEKYCGPGGSGGGIVMFFLGSFGLPVFWFSFLNVASYSGHFDQLPRFRIVIQISLVVSIVAVYMCLMGPFMLWLIDVNDNTTTGFSVTDVFYQAIVGLFYFGMFCQAGLYVTFHDTGAGVSLLVSLDRPIRAIPRWYLILLGIPICLSYYIGNLSVAFQGGNFFGNENFWSYFTMLWTLITGIVGFYVMYRIIIIYLVGLRELKIKVNDIEIPSLDLDDMRTWHKSMLDLKMDVSDFSAKFQYMALIIFSSDIFLLILHTFIGLLENNFSVFYVQVLSLTVSVTILAMFLIYDMLLVNTMILEKVEEVRDSLVIAAQDDSIPSDLYMQLLSCVNVWKLESKKLCIDMYGFPVDKTKFLIIFVVVLFNLGVFLYKAFTED